MHISKELPELAAMAKTRDRVVQFLDGHGYALTDIDHWILHPGGRAILEDFQTSLSLTDEQCEPALRVARRYKNTVEAGDDEGEPGLVHARGPSTARELRERVGQ